MIQEQVYIPVQKKKTGKKSVAIPVADITKVAETKTTDTLEIDFVRPIVNKSGECIDIQLKYVELRNLIQSFGFSRYDIDNTASLFVRIKDQVIEETKRTAIIDAFEDYVNKLEEEIETANGVQINRSMLIEKIFRGIGGYFKEDFLHRLRHSSPITFAADTKDTAYFYYRNGFVECTAKGYTFKPYSELEGYIWRNQIIDRDFKKIELEHDLSSEESPVIARFFLRICGENTKRLASLMSITGYLLHNFKETKLKAVALTDSNISEDADGRTGKTLFGKILSKVRNTVELNGKDFVGENQRKYQLCALDSQIVHINDLTYSFNLKDIYNDITEGLVVDKKNEKPFRIFPKVLLSTNRTLKVDGASDRDRVIEFEFSSFFSDKHSPEDEFKHWFFRDWNETEWQRFDNFMAHCTCMFLVNGIVMTETINLESRKMLDHTSSEFLEFMVEDNFIGVHGGIEANSYSKIDFEVYYNVKTLFNRFLECYPDFDTRMRQGKFTQKRFFMWVDYYTTYHKDFKRFNKLTDKRKSGAEQYIKFTQADETKTS